MPTYLSRNQDGIYIFRRGVPAALRKFLGKTEIKKSLGANFSQARKKCNELSVETDLQFESARKQLTRTPLKSSLDLNAFYDNLEVVNEVTPSFIQQFRAFLLAASDVADFQRRSESFENFPKQEVTEANGGVAPLLKKAIATGDASAFIPVMHQTLHLRGYRLPDSLHGTKDEHRLAFEFVRTTQETQRLITTRDNGDYFSVKLPAEPLPEGAKPLEAQPESDKKKLSFFINEFLASWPANKKSMRSKLVKALTLFKEVTTDLDIDRLRQEHIKDFFRLLHRLPPRWQEAARREALTAKELAAKDHAVCIAEETFESYRASISIFIVWSIDNYHDQGFPVNLHTKRIKYIGTRKKGLFKQRALKPDELKRIFEGQELAAFAANPEEVHKFWLPVVALFTGARITEICQINPQTDWLVEHDIHFLHMTAGTDAADGIEKSIKMDVSRKVPIHNSLIELGFLQFLASVKKEGHKIIFPAWLPGPEVQEKRAGAIPGSWFTDFLKEINLHGVVNEEGNALRGVHAFRHNALTWGEMAGISLEIVTGHVTSSRPNFHSNSRQRESINKVAQGYKDKTLLLPHVRAKALLDRLEFELKIPRPVLPKFPDRTVTVASAGHTRMQISRRPKKTS